jgi:hypothetical protein
LVILGFLFQTDVPAQVLVCDKTNILAKLLKEQINLIRKSKEIVEESNVSTKFTL